MTLWRVTRLVVLMPCAAMALWPSMPAVAEDAGWRQAMDRLAHEKTLAEGCVSVLKTFADRDPMARVQGERLYARAKADVDGLIALLKIDLAGDRSPPEIPDLRHRLTTVPAQRQTLCRHVEGAIGSASRERRRAVALLTEATSGAVSPLLDAATQIWKAYRHADRADRKAITSAIDRTRWREYAQVPDA